MFFSKNKFLGIDIGSFSIKIVQFSKNKTLENYGEVAVKERSNIFSKKKDVRTEEFVAKSIRSLLTETKMSAKEAFFSIPNFTNFFTSFSLPPMKEEDVENSIKYQAKKHIPVPLSEVILDWSINQEKDGERSVSLVAVPNSVLYQYQNIATLCGLEITAIEMEAFSLNRLINEKGLNIIINIGFSNSTINVIEDGIVKVAYTSNFSSSEIDEALASSFKLNYNQKEAIQAKETKGMLEKNKDVISPLVDYFLNETESAVVNYLKKDKNQVKKIFLCGGGSLLLGLKEHISEKWPAEVQHINLNSIKSPISSVEVSSVFSTAIGMAMYKGEKRKLWQ